MEELFKELSKLLEAKNARMEWLESSLKYSQNKCDEMEKEIEKLHKKLAEKELEYGSR